MIVMLYLHGLPAISDSLNVQTLKGWTLELEA